MSVPAKFAAETLAAARFPMQASIVGVIVLLLFVDPLVRLARHYLVTGTPSLLMIFVWILAAFFALIAAFLLVHYGGLVFDRSVRGERTIRIMDGWDVFPYVSPVAPRVLLLALIAAALLTATEMATHPAWPVGLAVLAVLLPACLTILLLEGSLAAALDPRRIGTLVLALGWRYVLMLIVVALLAAACTWLARSGWPWPLATLVASYAGFAVLHALGRIVYSRRDRLGLDVTRAPELDEERRARDLHAEHTRMLEHAYGRAQVDVADALATIERYLADGRDELDTRLWLFERLKTWADPATAVWFGNDLVPRLLQHQRGNEAAAVTTWCMHQRDDFRPRGDRATFDTARIVLTEGRPQLATRLLSDFAARFPDSPLCAAADLTLAQLAIEKTGDRALASAALERLESRPGAASNERTASLRRLFDAGVD